MVRSEPKGRQRGAALISTLLAALLLSVLGSLASQQATMSWLLAQRLRTGTEALVAAESALALALADLTIEPRFDRVDLPAGSDFPFAGPPVSVPNPRSFRLHLEIQPRSANRIDVSSTATGPRRTRRTVRFTVEAAAAPFVPAALFLGGPSPSIAAGDSFAVRGPSSGDEALPALATPSRTAARDLVDRLAAAGAEVSGETGAATWSGIDEVLQKIRAAGRELASAIDGTVPTGMWASRASLEAGSVAGSGIWLVDGDLAIRSSLSFEGILLVAGDIDIDPGASLELAGSMVQLAPGRSIRARGDLTVEYDASAIRMADTLDPELLGRRATVIGWREGV